MLEGSFDPSFSQSMQKIAACNSSIKFYHLNYLMVNTRTTIIILSNKGAWLDVNSTLLEALIIEKEVLQHR